MENKTSKKIILDDSYKNKTKVQKLEKIIQTESELSYLSSEGIKIVNKSNSDYIIIPKDEIAINFLKEVGDFKEFVPKTKFQYVIKGIKTDFPTDYIKDRLKERGETEIERLKYRNKDGVWEDSRVIKLTTEYRIKEDKITLGLLGIRTVHYFKKPPMRCYRCQQFGHLAGNCSNNKKCGVCSQDHDTKQCLQKKN